MANVPTIGIGFLVSYSVNEADSDDGDDGRLTDLESNRSIGMERQLILRLYE